MDFHTNLQPWPGIRSSNCWHWEPNPGKLECEKLMNSNLKKKCLVNIPPSGLREHLELRAILSISSLSFYIQWHFMRHDKLLGKNLQPCLRGNAGFNESSLLPEVPFFNDADGNISVLFIFHEQPT